MPYRNTSQLPQAVREHLPAHALGIYMRAFNNAWKQYKDPRKRHKEGTREETAHRVAWAAVERTYKKGNSGRWQRKPS